MTTDTSASAHQETPHADHTLRRRAESVIYDSLIDPQWRTIIRYALEIDDPWLPDLVQRAEAGENIIDTFESLRTPDTDEDSKKVAALSELICRAGDESTAALFVLMGTLEKSWDPKALANTAKHFAFTRCVELNLYGMLDAQLALLERELLPSMS